MHLLQAAYDQSAPPEVSRLKEVETLRQIWVQHYYQEEGHVRWRARGNLPPSAKMIASPHDLDARYSMKRNTHWTGYKVHLTETCDADKPCLITHVETTPATTFDGAVTDTIHADLAAHNLLPEQHIVDSNYLDAALLVNDYRVDLVGPMMPDTQWQARAGEGFDISYFTIDWDTLTATCPNGKTSHPAKKAQTRRGAPLIALAFRREDCAACPLRVKCTHSATAGRELTLRPKEQHMVLQAARARQQTEDFTLLYAIRAGVEGTISQAVVALGMRQARYRGMPKTHFQHIATAVAINLARVFAWWQEIPRAKTRVSHFAALAA